MRTEDKLVQLRAMGAASITPNVTAELRKLLSSANNVLVSKAADVVRKHGAAELCPALASAFERFLEKPAKSDKGCLAKTALVVALDAVAYDDTELFRQGIRHVQMEAAYGGPVDTAAALRAKCAFALARTGHTDVLFDLTTLLTDPESEARVAAVRALAHISSVESELLLRLKASSGDDEPDVLGECFAGLIGLNAERSVPFVAEFLDWDNPDVAASAALALGESRELAALERLQACRRNSVVVDRQSREMLLLAIALTRRDEAVKDLLQVVAEENVQDAASALKALTVYSHDETTCKKLRAVVQNRGDVGVSEAYQHEFRSTPA